MDLKQELGKIDIYLLDQVLRGNIAPDSVVLDAGCGSGRNLHAFMRWGYEVHGADQDPAAIERVQALAKKLGYDALDRFKVEPVEQLSAAEQSMDLVICNAVLHFARDDEHFGAMVKELHRVLKPGGMAFCRIASSIGIEHQVKALDGSQPASTAIQAGQPMPCPPGWYQLPDQSHRYLVNIDYLMTFTQKLNLQLVDPIKTVNVQGIRCMTNWVWRK